MQRIVRQTGARSSPTAWKSAAVVARGAIHGENLPTLLCVMSWAGSTRTATDRTRRLRASCSPGGRRGESARRCRDATRLLQCRDAADRGHCRVRGPRSAVRVVDRAHPTRQAVTRPDRRTFGFVLLGAPVGSVAAMCLAATLLPRLGSSTHRPGRVVRVLRAGPLVGLTGTLPAGEYGMMVSLRGQEIARGCHWPTQCASSSWCRRAGTTTPPSSSADLSCRSAAVPATRQASSPDRTPRSGCRLPRWR